ncbi:aspartic proteinase nepenthesin-1 [Neltuma alba]|uniref:aspartic proteinase nepenthesin-1 n=1 Tax=Neltuma alba TaxID=207710 RepID=UPI0010A3B65B|nr:aspartic proteinase nepenthesin-1-like [Prosopis alba]
MAASSLFLLVPLFALLFLGHPSSSTSRSRALITNTDSIRPIRLNLHHVDSAQNLSKLERLQHGIKRGQARLQRFNSIVLAASSSASQSSDQLEAPVYAGRGAYLVSLSIGTPPKSYSAVLDTGSDLIWTQCKPCSKCYNQPSPIFDPKESSSFSALSCSSDLCSALPSSSCDKNTCNYLYSYGDNSFTQGILATETFTFGENKKDQTAVKNIGFGCGEDNEGDGLDQASGLVGLGRGPLSLISQLHEPKFSYCLTSMDDSAASTLFLGSFPSSKEPVTTSLLTNPTLPSFYYLPLEGISVGETRLGIDKSIFDIKKDASGGVIIDSGTTITYLEKEAYEALKKEFISQTNLPVDTSGSTGLDLCFSLPSDSSQVKIPRKLVFHFKDADLELPTQNYMVADSSSSVACLAMGASSGLSIFGNLQQQNVLVNYDVLKETISFLPTQCDSM